MAIWDQLLQLLKQLVTSCPEQTNLVFLILPPACLLPRWISASSLYDSGNSAFRPKVGWEIYLITEKGFTRLLLCLKQCRLREGLLGIDGDSIFSGSRRMRRRNRYIEIQIKPFLQEMLREFYRWYEEITKKLSLGIGGDAPGYATLLELFATVQMAVS